MFRYGFQQTFFIFSRFAVDIGMDVNFTIRPFWVAEANFRSCDVTGGIPIIAQPTSEEFEVQPEYLKPGTNYFIGRLQLSIHIEYTVGDPRISEREKVYIRKTRRNPEYVQKYKQKTPPPPPHPHPSIKEKSTRDPQITLKQCQTRKDNKTPDRSDRSPL